MNPSSTQASPAPQNQPESVSKTSKYQQKLQEINQQLSDTYTSPNNSDNSEDDDQEEEEEVEEEVQQIEKEEHQDQGDAQVIYHLPAPPPAVYRSEEAMMSSIKGFAREHGYVIVIRRSDKEKRKIFKCDRYIYLSFFLDFFAHCTYHMTNSFLSSFASFLSYGKI